MSTAPQQLTQPWLVAAWPGMGGVGSAAASILIRELSPTLEHQLPERAFFELNHVEVEEGITSPGRLPRSLFFSWKDPNEQHDLLIFLGEAQPERQGHELSERVMDYAQSRGVQRVITFAAMGTQLHPAGKPRVFAAATKPALLAELGPSGIDVLKEGQIGGLNGMLLGSAMERNIEGACLLGEIPFFAAGIPNPRSVQRVLQVFSRVHGVQLNTEDLNEPAETMEAKMIEMMERAGVELPTPEPWEQATTEEQEEPDAPTSKPPAASKSASPTDPTKKPEPQESTPLSYQDRDRIERLFAAATTDKTKAMDLKRELDRLNVFNSYENRFLDLFRKGE